jgi:hypothetical protein
MKNLPCHNWDCKKHVQKIPFCRNEQCKKRDPIGPTLKPVIISDKDLKRIGTGGIK